jgi:DNA polymerase delta subunit 1
MKLAPEKVMCPSEFLAKKRYVCGYYESTPHKPDKVYYRGVEVVRRDNCAMTTKCLRACCELIFLERKITEAVQVAKDAIERLYLNKVDISELIITKSLSQPVEDYATPQAHSRLAGKMAKREPMTAPAVGDRIPYVMVGEGVKGGVAELAEDPIYTMENEIPINIEYYIKNQLQKPLMRLFGPIIGEKQTNAIFGGDHTLKRVKATPKKKAGGILGFVTMMKVCKECRRQYNPADHKHPNLCHTCIEEHGEEVLGKKRKRYSEIKVEYEAQLSTCQTCQGSDRDPVLCMARSCPELYKRKGLEFRHNKALADIEDMESFIVKKVPK